MANTCRPARPTVGGCHPTAALLVALLFCCLPSTGKAQLGFFRAWVPSSGGSYSNPLNWSPVGVPNVDDGAGFQLDSEYSVSIGSNQTTGVVTVSRGNVTFDLNSSGTPRTLAVPGRLTVGGNNSATLVIQDGTVTAGDVVVKGAGFLDINADFGGDSILNVSGDIDIDGGRLRKLGGDQLNLDPGSDITVQNGGVFDYVNRYHLHRDNTFEAVSGGDMEFSSLDIAGTGATGNGTLLVDGVGSTVLSNFAVSSQTWGANGRTATIEVTNGGRIDIDEEDLLLANDGSAATTTITVDGEGSVFAHADGGAQVILGHGSTGSATVNVRNGGLFSAEAGSAGNGRLIVNSTGTVHAESGGTFDARFISMNGGTIDFDGGVLRFLSFGGNLSNPGGTLDVGRSLGSSFVSGNYTQQEAGSLRVEIGGILAGQSDSLVVTGNAIVNGSLDVDVINDFVPVPGNEFTIVSTSIGNVAGEFDTLNFPVFEGMTFDVAYTPKSVVLEVVEAAILAGDYNNDGLVNIADYAVWRNQLGSDVSLPNDDTAGVGPDDYDRWKAHFGETAVTTSAAHNPVGSVPEPTTCGMILAGALAFLLRCLDRGAALSRDLPLRRVMLELSRGNKGFNRLH